VLHDHLGRVAGEGVGQCRDEGGDFLATVDRIDDAARIGAQHVALVGDLDPRDLSRRRFMAFEAQVRNRLSWRLRRMLPT
jgi:hypothetical protein